MSRRRLLEDEAVQGLKVAHYDTATVNRQTKARGVAWNTADKSPGGMS